jgi:uroporphyrinogen decarboxylase
MNQRFQNALKGVPQKNPPIWFMRQAGRYHKHYQALRKNYSFMELCKEPVLAAQVALGPVQDFDFDVSIMFSDLLFPLEAMGMGLEYGDSGPKLGWHLNQDTIKNLNTVKDALPGLKFQKQVLIETRKVLPEDKSLIGFVGAPWTLFTYAVQGRHDGSLLQAKKNLSLYKSFCEILVPLLKENIQLQFDGGAEVIMLFDTAAGELSPSIYKELVVPTLEVLSYEFKGKLGYYAKTVSPAHLQSIIFSNKTFAGLGFDHRWDISQVLSENKYSGFKQGCFDQALLFLEKNEFKNELEKYLAPFKKLSLEDRASWVCGLGHGVLPLTPEENVRQFISQVRETFC